MAAKLSAGILLYRLRGAETEVLLVHPGGPFFKRKDHGAWTVPKGEVSDGEDPLEAAQREFAEETGHRLLGPFVPLGEIRQAGGKRVQAWASEGECDPERVVSNTFPLEWPPKSGTVVQFPEIDRAAWFSWAEAAQRINPAQRELLDRLKTLLENP